MLDQGDRVLVKIVAYKGKHKIADRWEEEPSIIIRKPNADMPVYVVQKEDGTGPERTLHRTFCYPSDMYPWKKFSKPTASCQQENGVL